jgi:hypothetical protein
LQAKGFRRYGIVSKRHADERDMEYEILYGNEPIGAKSGQLGDKATDHAYVIGPHRIALSEMLIAITPPRNQCPSET